MRTINTYISKNNIVFALFFILFSTLSMALQGQILDESFSTSLTSRSRIADIAQDSDGKIYVAGNFKLVNNEVINPRFRNNIVRLNPDRTLDETFNLDNELSKSDIFDITIANGKIIIIAAEPGTNHLITVLNSDGSVEEEFSLDTEIRNVTKATFDGTNYVLIDAHDQKLIKLLGDGSIDPGFEPRSIVGFSFSNFIILDNDQILISGNYSKYDGQDVGPVFRVNADGTLDDTFNNTGSSTIGQVNQMALDTEGNIYAIGFFTTFNGESTPGGIIKLKSDGSVDPSFDRNIAANILSETPRKLIIDQNNSIYLIGADFSNGNFKKVASLNSDGTANQSFAALEFNAGNSSFEYSLELIGDKLIMAADFFRTGSELRLGIATADLNGNLLSAPTQFTKESTITSALVQSDEKVIVAGDFQFVNGIHKPGLVRLNADGTVDDSFSIGIDLNETSLNTINSLALQSDNKILIGGRVFNQSFNAIVARLNPDGSLDHSFDDAPEIGNLVYKIHLLDDGRIVTMGRNILNTSGGNMVILKTDGSLDNSFSTNVFQNEHIIKEFKVLPDGTYLVGGEIQVSGFVFRIDTDGSLVSEITLENTVDALEVTDSKFLIGGINTSGGSFSDKTFLRQTDFDFNTQDQVSIGIVGFTNFGFYRDILNVDNNSILVAGFYDLINSQDHIGLSRITLAGSVDDQFNFNVKGWVDKVIPVDSEHILAAGPFSQVNERNLFSLAKIKTVNTPAKITGTRTDFMTNEEQTIEIEIDDLIIEDPDDELGAMTIVMGQGESFSFDGNTVTPDQDFNGTLSVPIQINDGNDTGDVFNISIEVLPVNDPPEITGYSGASTTEEETSLNFSIDDFSITDPDNSSDAFTLVILEGENYSVDGLAVTPTTDFNGTITVLVNVNDGTDDSESFSVELEVTAVNDAPVITGTSLSLTTDNETPFVVNLTDLQVTDPDNSFPSDFTLTLVSGDNYSIDGNAIVPATEFIGSITVPIFVNDGNIDSETFNLIIEVTEVTGFELESISKKVEVFPNPVEGQLNLSIENQLFDDVQIRIINSNGFEVFNGNYRKNKELFHKVLDVNHLGSGVFMIEIIQRGQKSVKRIIKN